MAAFIIRSFLITSTLATLLVHYKFGSVFNQSFLDLSGSENHGQNGASTSSLIHDTSSIDRGAFFSSSSEFIQLPPNDLKSSSITIGQYFSIVMWIYPFNTSTDHFLSMRFKDCENFMSFTRVMTYHSIRGEIKNNNNLTARSSPSFNIALPRTWVLVSLHSSSSFFDFYTNGVKRFTMTLLSPYSETGTYYHYIGYKNSSFVGYLWSFFLYDNNVNLHEFYSDTYGGSNCLVPICTPPCTPAIRQDSVDYCISTSEYSNCELCSKICIDSAYPDYPLCTSERCNENSESFRCFCFNHRNLLNCSCDAKFFFNRKVFQCRSCEDANAEPDKSSGCVCKKGFFNVSEISDNESCLPCQSSCESCSQSETCLTCKDKKAKPKLEKGCECEKGFFNSTPLEENGSCQSCYSDCSSCSEELECINCIDFNSIPVKEGKGCECKERFYNLTSLDKNDSCLPCFNECLSCSHEFNCTKCADINSLPTDSGECRCNQGFYKKITSEINTFCEKCHFECKTCEKPFQCLTCLDENSKVSPTQGCDCIEEHFKDGKCKRCHPDCKICKNLKSCSVCKDSSAYFNGTSCICKPGFFNSSTNSQLECSKCEENCKTCENLDFCLECLNSQMSPTNGSCKCGDSQYLNNGTCENCPVLCLTCGPDCKTCVKNSEVNESGLCECDLGFGYSSDNSCVERFFQGFLEILSIKFVALGFSEPLGEKLMEDKFLFSVGGRSDFKVKLLKADSSRLLFGMKFEDEVVEGTVLDVKIVSSAVYSKNRAQLEKYRFSGKLPEYKPVENPDMEDLMNSTHHIIKVAVTTSIGSSLISNPAAAWALLNTIQLLIFLPLNINEMTPNVRKFLKGFQGYNILPNFFEKIINSKASSEPYQEAKNFGLVTSVFLISAGKILTILIVALLLWPLVIVVSRSKAGNFSLKALKILGNFKYSFFLRFWIQGFLEILVFSLVQLRSEVVYPVQGYFSELVASLAALATVLSTPLIFVCSFVSFSKISEGSEGFKKKWGSLFVEFKNDKGFFSTQYYFLYFARRVSYAFSQIFLNSWPFIQAGLNVSTSILSLAFLIYYKPFIKLSSFITNFAGELVITLVMIISSCYLWDLSDSTKKIYELVIIFSIISSVCIQFIIFIYTFIQAIKHLWEKLVKIRAIEFVNNFEGICTSSHNRRT